MKKILFLLLLSFSLLSFSQDFFDGQIKKNKKYVVLTNPTVHNIKTIRYLTNRNLLDINKRKIKFVGVYYTGQNYDFTQTKKYIEENKLKNYYLHKIDGNLSEANLFTKNDCTDDIELVFKHSVGVFFFGGPDIPPGIYGERNTHSVVTDPGRHYFETTFLYHLLGGFQDENFKAFLHQKPQYLVTGFCLGMQTMNVATGGTLIQDIPAEIYGAETPEATVKIGRANLHRNYWQKIDDDTLLMGINLHTIQFSENSFFTEKVNVSQKWNPRIYSSHHQAVEKIGKDLDITAFSPDGKIVEGLAHTKFPHVFAVHFHPEVPALYEDLYVRKFHPEDQPMSYNDIIGKQSLKFHKKYWHYISKILSRVKNKNRN